MGQGKEDVEHGQVGGGGPVLYGLHPRYRPSSLLERVRSGPKAQHRSLYGAGLSTQIPEREHTNYLMGRKRLPLQPPSDPMWEDRIFAALRRAVPKPHARERRKNGWISEDTWRLVDERVSARRNPARDQTRIRRLSRAIAASLK